MIRVAWSNAALFYFSTIFFTFYVPPEPVVNPMTPSNKMELRVPCQNFMKALSMTRLEKKSTGSMVYSRSVTTSLIDPPAFKRCTLYQIGLDEHGKLFYSIKVLFQPTTNNLKLTNKEFASINRPPISRTDTLRKNRFYCNLLKCVQIHVLHRPTRRSEMQNLRSVGAILAATRVHIRRISCGITQNLQGQRLITHIANKLNLTDNNVLKSGLLNVTGFDNVYLHEYIWEHIDRWPDQVAVECAATGKFYTYSQLRKLCGRFATVLRKSRILPGDCIAVILPNIPEYAIVVCGASEAGVCLALINPMYTLEEMRNLLSRVNVNAVITVPDKYEMLKKCADVIPNLKMPIILVNDGTSPIASECINFKDLIRDDIEEFSTQEKTDCDYNATVLIPFSSGTTGPPKGVELSHRNLVVNFMQYINPEVTMTQLATKTYQEVFTSPLPLFHAYGLLVTLLHALRLGAKTVTLPKFTMVDWLDLLMKHETSILMAVPPIIQMMAKSPKVTPEHVRNLRLVASGGAPLGSETIEMFRNRTSPDIGFIQGYGLTETSPMVSSSYNAPIDSVGYLIPNTEIRIVDKTNRNLGLNEIGELHIKGPQVMKGYYNDLKATKDTMDGEWFKTGDLACYDEKGCLYIKGRLKELIKVKGFQVAPVELEDVIRSLDKVENVAVIGIEHEEYGEVPKAFVVLKPKTSATVEEIKSYVAERVAKFKRLETVQFVDSIPMNAAGKILRRELKKIPP